jgi:hypothetical protein
LAASRPVDLVSGSSQRPAAQLDLHTIAVTQPERRAGGGSYSQSRIDERATPAHDRCLVHESANLSYGIVTQTAVPFLRARQRYGIVTQDPRRYSPPRLMLGRSAVSPDSVLRAATLPAHQYGSTFMPRTGQGPTAETLRQPKSPSPVKRPVLRVTASDVSPVATSAERQRGAGSVARRTSSDTRGAVPDVIGGP